MTANNFSLEDHWNQGNARAAIAKGGWSVVVLQQGPSALPESRVLLRDYSKRFAAEARKAGARTALYMVWPSKARARDFDDVSESYALAARDVAGTAAAGRRRVARGVAARSVTGALRGRRVSSERLGLVPGGARDLESAVGAVRGRPAGPAQA